MTGRLRSPFDEIFAHVREMAGRTGKSPRAYIEELIDGVKRIRRTQPEFVPETKKLLDREYRRLLLRRHRDH